MSEKPHPDSLPCSPLDEVCGIVYFARMVAKIRLNDAGMLWDELKENLGKGQDLTCSEFLHVNYEALRRRVLEGGCDEEIYGWCEAVGRPLNETDKRVWNEFVRKLGWNDSIRPILDRRKSESGLDHRDDIETIIHYIDVDEGRKP